MFPRISDVCAVAAWDIKLLFSKSPEMNVLCSFGRSTLLLSLQLQASACEMKLVVKGRRIAELFATNTLCAVGPLRGAAAAVTGVVQSRVTVDSS